MKNMYTYTLEKIYKHSYLHREKRKVKNNDYVESLQSHERMMTNLHFTSREDNDQLNNKTEPFELN